MGPSNSVQRTQLRFDITTFNDIVIKAQDLSQGQNNQFLSQFQCQIVHHQGYKTKAVCVHRKCNAKSRRSCLVCLLQNLHSSDQDYKQEYILTESQIFFIIEEYQRMIKQELQYIHFSFLIFSLELSNEDNIHIRHNLGEYLLDVKQKISQFDHSFRINMNIENYINELHINTSLFEFLKQNFLELYDNYPKLKSFSDLKQKKKFKEQFQNIEQLKGDIQIEQEMANNKKKNLLDILRQIFESRIYQENLVSQDDQKIIDRSIEILLRYAIEELGSNKIQDAIQICDIVIQNCKTNFQALTIKGMCLDKQSKYEEALQMFDQAILIKSDYYESYFRKGITLNHMKLYQKAIDQYKRALQLEQKSYQIYNKLANVYIKINQFDQCMAQLYLCKKKIHKDQQKYQKFKVYQKMGQLIKAQEKIPLLNDFDNQNESQLLYLFRIEKYSFDKAINLYPQLPLAQEKKQSFIFSLNMHDQNQKGDLINKYIQNVNWKEKQKYDELMEKFEGSQQIKNFNYHKQKGIVQYQFNFYRKSIDSFEMAIQLNPNDSEIYFLQECARCHLLKMDIQIKIIDQAAQYDQQNTYYQIQKGYTLIILKEYGIARQCFENAINIDQQLFEPQCSRAFCDTKLQHNFDGNNTSFKDIIRANSEKIDRVREFAQFFISIKEFYWALIIYECLYEYRRDDIHIKQIIIQLKAKLIIDNI